MKRAYKYRSRLLGRTAKKKYVTKWLKENREVQVKENNRLLKEKKQKDWAYIREKYLPEIKLAQIHRKLLDKKEVLIISDGTQRGSHLESTGQPHSDALRAVDMAYKVKSLYPKEGGNNQVLIINISGQSASRYDSHTSPSDNSN